MKKNRKHTDASVPQSVTGFIKLKTERQAIQIGFTDQKVSPHAGLATFAGFLHWHRFGQVLGKLLPHQPKSNYALKPVDIALGYVAAMLAGARKLAQVAHLRSDPALPPLLQIKRVAS